MIDRAVSAERVNEIVNDPSVYPWVRGRHTGPLDVSAVIADRANYALFGEHGGVIFIRLAPGYYEAHTQVLPAGRGRWTLAMVQEALKWMFVRTDAVEITTRVPEGNLGAKALMRAIHGELEFTSPRGWFKDGRVIPADICSLTIQRWIKTALGLEARGEWFHDRLERQYAEKGKAEDVHEDDPTHDRFVGAAVEMFLGGQPDKGVIFYNRWAVMAGYEPVSILTRDPVTVDIRQSILLIGKDNFWVI